MKKVNKIGLWTGALSVTLAAVAAPTSLRYAQAHKSGSASERASNTENLDYQSIDQIINSQTDTYQVIRQSLNLSIDRTGETTPKLTQEQEALVKQKQNEYLQFFKDRNFNLEQINAYLSTTFEGYEPAYDDGLALLNKNLLSPVTITSRANVLAPGSGGQNYYKYSPTYTLRVKTESELYDLINKLKIAKDSFAGISAAAAIAAAGCWAATGFFGISAIWATAFTVSSSIAGGIAGCLDAAIIAHERMANSSVYYLMGDVSRGVLDVVKVASAIGKIVNVTLLGFEAAAAAVVWAFPPILGSIGLVHAILSLTGAI